MQDQTRIANRTELDQPHPAWVVLAHSCEHMQRQAYLSDAARPGQRQQARTAEQVLDVRRRLDPTDEASHLSWQVVPRAPGGPDVASQHRGPASFGAWPAPKEGDLRRRRGLGNSPEIRTVETLTQGR